MPVTVACSFLGSMKEWHQQNSLVDSHNLHTPCFLVNQAKRPHPKEAIKNSKTGLANLMTLGFSTHSILF